MPIQLQALSKPVETEGLPHDNSALATHHRAPPFSARMVDDMLLARVATGDAAAFRELTHRHIDRAFAIAFRILGNSADAEDVVQDCFVKVWTMGKTWEPGRAAFSTWLYRVVTNRCLDFKRRPQNVDVDEVPETASETPTQVEQLLQHEATELLSVALSGLPAQQKAALILSYYEGHSNREIAELMQISVMAVESLLKRGRQLLRAKLAGDQAEILHSLIRD